MTSINVTSINITIGNQPAVSQTISTGEAFEQMMAAFGGKQCKQEDGIISASSFKANVVPADMNKDANGNYDLAGNLLAQILAMLNEIDEQEHAKKPENALDQIAQSQAPAVDNTDMGPQADLAGAANIVSI